MLGQFDMAKRKKKVRIVRSKDKKNNTHIVSRCDCDICIQFRKDAGMRSDYYFKNNMAIDKLKSSTPAKNLEIHRAPMDLLMRDTSVKCPYCSCGVLHPVVCPHCETPHCAECWNERPGCCTYGCNDGKKKNNKSSYETIPEGYYEKTSLHPIGEGRVSIEDYKLASKHLEQIDILKQKYETMSRDSRYKTAILEHNDKEVGKLILKQANVYQRDWFVFKIIVLTMFVAFAVPLMIKYFAVE